MKKVLIVILSIILLTTSCNTQNLSGNEDLTSSQGSVSSDREDISSSKKEEESSNVVEEEKAPSSKIFIQKNTNGADDGVQRLIKLMEDNNSAFYKTKENPEGIIGSEDVVLLKVNAQWSKLGSTNTDLVKNLALAITKHPDGFTGEIIVADNGQAQWGTRGTGGSLDFDENNSLNKNQSYQDIIDELQALNLPVTGYLWDTITLNAVKEFKQGDYEDGFIVEEKIYEFSGLQVSYPKFTSEKRNQISFKYGVWNKNTEKYDSDRLVVINMPVLKRHPLYQQTGAIKHYMGVPSDRLTNEGETFGRAHNSVGKGGMGELMAATRMPALNIVDVISYSPYPVGSFDIPYENALETNTIAASVDACAIDYWLTKHIMIPESTKVDPKDVWELDPDSDEEGTFGYWLKLSHKAIVDAGFWSTLDESEMEVFTGE